MQRKKQESGSWKPVIIVFIVIGVGVLGVFGYSAIGEASEKAKAAKLENAKEATKKAKAEAKEMQKIESKIYWAERDGKYADARDLREKNGIVRTCPHCEEVIKEWASTCPHCQNKLGVSNY